MQHRYVTLIFWNFYHAAGGAQKNTGTTITATESAFNAYNMLNEENKGTERNFDFRVYMQLECNITGTEPRFSACKRLCEENRGRNFEVPCL